MSREPETGDASKAEPWDIDLYYDLAYNLFVTPRRTPENVRAQNVNTIDEVPDSSWFTNRIGARPMSIEELQRGPGDGAGAGIRPCGPSHARRARATRRGSRPPTPTARRGSSRSTRPVNPDGATGAVVIATKIFWALGYNQVEYFLTDFKHEAVKIGDKATKRRPSGRRTPMDDSDIKEVLERAHRRQDGSYRAAAGRLLPGKVLGGFKYQGTRPDDPNDVVPHEHRRELRALRVFGAWTNLTDMKAGNTLDTVITEGGRGLVRHYLQDVGSTFGVGANGPHEWNEGWEHIYEGGPSRRRLFTFGLDRSPWQTAPYSKHAAVGRFEGDAFDPETWKPRAPTAAYMEMRDDDAFWAARRVMAFSDELIRAVVQTGEFADTAAEAHLAEVLIKRRDKIGRTYLTRLNPIVDPALDPSGALSFGNAAVDHRFAEPPASYAARWSAFDNATGESRAIGETKGERSPLQAPAGLPAAPGGYIQVELSADHPNFASWKQPVRVFFRREAAGWKLVGLERMP